MYEISLSSRAQKNLKNLDPQKRKVVAAALDELAKDLFPIGKKVKRLLGVENGWRLRVGKLRVLYTIEDKVIRIYLIDKRGDVY